MSTLYVHSVVEVCCKQAMQGCSGQVRYQSIVSERIKGIDYYVNSTRKMLHSRIVAPAHAHKFYYILSEDVT